MRPKPTASGSALAALGRPPVRVRFTPPPSDRSASWTRRAPGTVLNAARIRYPDAVCWYGCFTQHYWFVSPRQTLVEAADEHELARLLGAWFPAVPPRPVPGRSHQEQARPLSQDGRRMVPTRAATGLAVTSQTPGQRPGRLRRTFQRLARRPADGPSRCGLPCCNPALRHPSDQWSSSC